MCLDMRSNEGYKKTEALSPFTTSLQFSKFAAVRVSRRFLNFTEHQDLQLSVGLDLDMPGVSKRASGGSSGVSQKLKPVSTWSALGSCFRFRVEGAPWCAHGPAAAAAAATGALASNSKWHQLP